MSQTLTIALSKGRILDDTLPLLKEAGIEPTEDLEKSRKLIFPTTDPNVRLLIVRATDVPTYVEHGSADLGVAEREVREMESRLYGQDLGFDGAQDDDDDTAYAPVHYLEDKRYDPATQLESADWSDSASSSLLSGLDELDERSRDILYQRWLAEEKATLHELAAKYQVSAERIRQLEKNAMNKLKKNLETEVAI